jgi:hypothetical protein
LKQLRFSKTPCGLFSNLNPALRLLQGDLTGLDLPRGRLFRPETCASRLFPHPGGFLRRKEVIQPQVPLRLPCYDFIPVTSYTLGPCLLAVGTGTSGATGFHDVTGGVYKTRERIHGAVDDAPLLAIPTSWRRVAASNPNWAQFCRFPPPRGLGSHCTGHCSTCAAQGVRAILT